MVRAWFRSKTLRVAMGVVAIGLAAFVVGRLSDASSSGKARLPVGAGTPAISLGDWHGLVLASDGSLWSWGSDYMGWPVLGSGTGKPMDHSTSLRRIGNDTNWVSISAAADHNLAIRADGTLWSWGRNAHGGGVRPAAVAVPAPAAPGNDWKQAAAGGQHSLALKKDGTLWAWGNNWAGRLGIASTNGSAVPEQVGTDTNWTRVWAGSVASMAMRSDGSLWCWGDLPSTNSNHPLTTVPGPTRFSPDTNWVDAGIANDTIFAIKAEGTLWAWGSQADLFTEGIGPQQNGVPRRVGTNDDWKAISTCLGGWWWSPGLVKKDGSLWLMETFHHRAGRPYPPVRFRREAFRGKYLAYTGAACLQGVPGPHLGIGVALTANGEVWTWGHILGEPPSFRDRALAVGARFLNILPLRQKIRRPLPYPAFSAREVPWQLRIE